MHSFWRNCCDGRVRPVGIARSEHRIIAELIIDAGRVFFAEHVIDREHSETLRRFRIAADVAGEEGVVERGERQVGVHAWAGSPADDLVRGRVAHTRRPQHTPSPVGDPGQVCHPLPFQLATMITTAKAPKGEIVDLLIHIISIAFTGAVLWLIVRYALPTRHCPRCHQTLPKFRKPQSVSQALFGGWTCRKCGTRVNFMGARV